MILNINADFKGILFAPNSPVVINGNGHKLQGFVVAESYVKLDLNDDLPESGYLLIDNYAAHKCNTHDLYHNNKMYTDNSGNVEYKKIGGSYETVDNLSFAYTYNLAESKFDSFNQIWLEYHTMSTAPSSIDNLFTTANAKMMT